MREIRSYRSISIIKSYHNHIFILIMKNEFYKTAFNYQNRKRIYSQYNLLFFTI